MHKFSLILQVFLHILSAASEFDELPVRHNEVTVLIAIKIGVDNLLIKILWSSDFCKYVRGGISNHKYVKF